MATSTLLQKLDGGSDCGVALHAATAGENLKTVIAGYAESVTSNGAMAIGNILTASGAVAGEVDGRIAADISAAFGVALEAGANPDCWIYKQF